MRLTFAPFRRTLRQIAMTGQASCRASRAKAVMVPEQIMFDRNCSLGRREKTPLILNPAKFSRDLQVDLCAECHNGIQREALKPAFSYVPGRPLNEYFKPLPSANAEHPDVHGNQVGLLQRSKCYRSSEQMSCSTCHDVHSSRTATRVVFA